jgi:MtN3 and saliva related transmembrane protein
MFDYTIIGIIAGVFTTVSLLPQVVKSARTKSTSDISLLWITILWIGVLLWLIYGLLIRDVPLIVANAPTIGLVSVMVIFKLKYK